MPSYGRSATASTIPTDLEVVTRHRGARSAGEPRELSVGLIGLGYWGVNHLRVINEMPGAAPIACSDLVEANFERVRHTYPHVACFRNPDRLLAHPGVDVVVISTPASTHYDLARRALLAGKHVLVEKPVALRAEQGEELGALADARGLVFMVAHTFIFNPAVVEAKRRLKSGQLGDPYYLHFTRTGLGPIRNDVNVMWDLVPHDVSIAMYLLDEHDAEVVNASSGEFLRPDVSDVVFLTLRFASGVIAHVHASWLEPRKKREMTIIGSEKMLVFDDMNPTDKLAIYDRGVLVGPVTGDFAEFQLSVRVGDVLLPKVEGGEPLREQWQHFLTCVREGERPLTDAGAGTQVVRLLEGAQALLEPGGAR